MKKRLVVGAIALVVSCGAAAQAADVQRPKAGKVEIFHLKDVKPGMQATAWTVFSGNRARAGAGRNHRRLEEANGPAAATSSSARWAARRKRPTSRRA